MEEMIAHKCVILEKARDMMLRLGLRNVSMDDIATSLGKSKKTLYNNYPNKESLVTEVFTSLFDENKETCLRDQKRATNAIEEIFFAMKMMSETLSNINPSIVNDMQKYHPNAFNKLKLFKQDFLYDVIKHNLMRGQKEKLYRKNLDIDILARFRVEAIFLFFTDGFKDVRNISYEAFQKELFIHYLYGVVNPAGYNMIEQYLKQYQIN